MRRKKRKLTIERKIELVRRHADGEDINALSKVFSTSVRQVYLVVAEQKGDIAELDRGHRR